MLIDETIGDDVTELGGVRLGDLGSELPGSVCTTKLNMLLPGHDTLLTSTPMFIKLA